MTDWDAFSNIGTRPRHPSGILNLLGKLDTVTAQLSKSFLDSGLRRSDESLVRRLVNAVTLVCLLDPVRCEKYS